MQHSNEASDSDEATDSKATGTDDTTTGPDAAGASGARGPEDPAGSVPEEVVGWFVGRLPDDWFVGRPRFRMDRDEILLVGELTAPVFDDGDSDGMKAAAASSRVDAFRKATRKQRVGIAREAERHFDRKVSWGVVCHGDDYLFATLAAPAMTRLRMDERSVLDTLIEGGVARSRSEALAWCVRLVKQNESEWLADLSDALGEVQRVRSSGPQA